MQAREPEPELVEPRFEDPVEGTWVRDQVHYASTMTAFGGSTYLPTLERAISAMHDVVASKSAA